MALQYALTTPSIRLKHNIAQKEVLSLLYAGQNDFSEYDDVVGKMCNLSAIGVCSDKPEGAVSFMVGTKECFIPLGDLVDVTEELNKLQAELEYQEGFLQSVLKKLGNEKFVAKAPEKVIEMERKKQADAESKILSLKERIAAMKK